MDISFRTAKLNDAGAITLLSEQLGYHATVNEIEERLALLINDSNNCIYVAEHNEQVLAWIHAFYTVRVETSPYIEIAGLVVDENLRGTGVGRLLINQIVNWAAAKNCAALRVRTNTIRKETHKFYERMGFIEIKEQKVYTKQINTKL